MTSPTPRLDFFSDASAPAARAAERHPNEKRRQNYDGIFSGQWHCKLADKSPRRNPPAELALNIKSFRLPDGYGFRGSLWGAPIAKVMVRANGGGK